MYLCMYVRKNVHIYAGVQVCTCTCTHIQFVNICVLGVCLCACINICTYLCMDVGLSI